MREEHADQRCAKGLTSEMQAKQARKREGTSWPKVVKKSGRLIEDRAVLTARIGGAS